MGRQGDEATEEFGHLLEDTKQEVLAAGFRPNLAVPD